MLAPRGAPGSGPMCRCPPNREDWGARAFLIALPGTARNHPSPLAGGIALGSRSISDCYHCLSPNAIGVRTSQRKSCCLRDPRQGLSFPRPGPHFSTTH